MCSSRLACDGLPAGDRALAGKVTLREAGRKTVPWLSLNE
jgi:hypothetical protein